MNPRAVRIFASSTVVGAIEDDITPAGKPPLLPVNDSAAREGEDTLIYSSSSSLKIPLVTSLASLTSLTLDFVAGNFCVGSGDENSNSAAKLRCCPTCIDDWRQDCSFVETQSLFEGPKHYTNCGLYFHDTVACFSVDSVIERTKLCQRINTNWGELLQDSSWKWSAGIFLEKTRSCWEAGVSGLCAKTNCLGAGFSSGFIQSFPTSASSSAAASAVLVPGHIDLLLVYTLCLLFSVYSFVLLAAAFSMGNEGSALSGSESSTPLSEYNSMYSLGSRVRSSVESTRAPSPMEPPEPDLSHLTEEEVAKIKAVMERAKLLQEEEQNRAR